MKKAFIILGVILFFVHDGIGEITDERIKEIVIYSRTVADNPHFADGMIRRTFGLCGYDTNRFVRVLQELAEEKAETRLTVISRLREFGNSTALPFLYQCVTNSSDLTTGFQASWAILQIEGVTSNSISQIDRFLKLPQNNNMSGRLACSSLLSYAKRPGVSSNLKALAVSRAIEHASRNSCYPDVVDGMIISADPSYRTSKRRLAALRAVSALEVHEDCSNYVATAINELVAYPEADLPE